MTRLCLAVLLIGLSLTGCGERQKRSVRGQNALEEGRASERQAAADRALETDESATERERVEAEPAEDEVSAADSAAEAPAAEQDEDSPSAGVSWTVEHEEAVPVRTAREQQVVIDGNSWVLARRRLGGSLWEKRLDGAWTKSTLTPSEGSVARARVFRVSNYPAASYEGAAFDRTIYAVLRPGSQMACALEFYDAIAPGNPARCNELPVSASPRASRTLRDSLVLHYLWRCPGSEAPCLLYGSDGREVRDLANATNPWRIRAIDPRGPEVDRTIFDPVTREGDPILWSGTLKDNGQDVEWYCGGEGCSDVFFQYPDGRLTGVRLEYSGPEPAANAHYVFEKAIALLPVQNGSAIAFARVELRAQTVDYFSSVGADPQRVPLEWDWEAEWANWVIELPSAWEYKLGKLVPVAPED